MMNIQVAVPMVQQATYFGLKASEWIMIVAIIVGPFAAVLTQLWAQDRKEKRNQKLWVFSTLMSLRGTPLHPDRVRALNYIDVVFYGNQQIRGRWQALLDYLTSSPDWQVPVPTQQTMDRTRDLGAQLLAEIAKDMGYGYDHTHIKEKAYYPKAYDVLEQQMIEIRTKAVDLLNGRGSVNIHAV